MLDCRSLYHALPHDDTPVTTAELQRIVLHYFFTEPTRLPNDYLPEIIRELTRRDPKPLERHFVQHLDNWLRNYYNTLDNYVIELVLTQGYSASELDPNDILESFELEYQVQLPHSASWITVIQHILREVEDVQW